MSDKIWDIQNLILDLSIFSVYGRGARLQWHGPLKNNTESNLYLSFSVVVLKKKNYGLFQLFRIGRHAVDNIKGDGGVLFLYESHGGKIQSHSFLLYQCWVVCIMSKIFASFSKFELYCCKIVSPYFYHYLFRNTFNQRCVEWLFNVLLV